MSAKSSDDHRVLEMLRVIRETRARLEELGVDRESFVNDESARGRTIADGIFMCVYRVSEEAANMTPQTQTSHPEIPWRAIKGMRNIFAHDYGKLDRGLVWNTVARDFTMLESFCLAYAEEHCLDI